jgi:hypothetical protein
MEDTRSPILRGWYSNHIASPEYVVLELDKHLPACYTHNNSVRMVYVSINEYLRELPYLIRFTGTAKEALETRIDELSADIYSQFPNYRDQPGIVQLVENVTHMLLNVGDELFHRLHEVNLYASGGFHHYEFDRALNTSTIALRKMQWPALVESVMHPPKLH